MEKHNPFENGSRPKREIVYKVPDGSTVRVAKFRKSWFCRHGDRVSGPMKLCPTVKEVESSLHVTGLKLELDPMKPGTPQWEARLAIRDKENGGSAKKPVKYAVVTCGRRIAAVAPNDRTAKSYAAYLNRTCPHEEAKVSLTTPEELRSHAHLLGSAVNLGCVLK